MAKKEITYKSFDQLVADVKSEMEHFDLDNKIKNHQLIKTAKSINYSLGLKIYKTKNTVLEVQNGRAKLPDDFLLVNYLYGLGKYKSKVVHPQGTQVEQVPVPEYFQNSDTIDKCATEPKCPTPDPYCPDPCKSPDPCGCSSCNCDTWINCKGKEMTLIQKIKYEVREWTEFYKIRLTGKDTYYDPLCLNKNWQAKHTGMIRDGWIYFSFKEGSIYLNYQGMMEDEHGNLVVLSHDEIDNYYDFGLKKKIIEILLSQDEQVNSNYIKLIFEEYRTSRIRAIGIARTPDFAELKSAWSRNRQAMFNRYFKMFS